MSTTPYETPKENEGGYRPYLVGLTGGLASGKSTVAGWLRDAGLPVHDADRIVADLYEPGAAGAAAVAALFGPGMLDARGAVDRGRLAARVFADVEARRRLEEAVHPLVRRRYRELAAEPAAREAGVMVFEATLMVESGSSRDLDLVVTVEADPELRLERAVARGLGEADARARLAAQGDGAARRAGAHRILHNDADLAHLRRQADDLIADLRRAGSARAAGTPGPASGNPAPGA